MKRAKKLMFIVLLAILVLIVFGWVYRTHLLNKGLPDYNAPVKIPGLTENVTLYRDSFAVPHIIASNEDDLYKVVGYLTAQDRLWQMDLFRRVTMGRLSEIFGKKLIYADKLMRMLSITEKSRKVIAQTDPVILRNFQAFADGVNLFIDQHKSKLPVEFSILGYKPEKWEIVHSFNLIGYIAWDLNGSWNSEIFLHKVTSKLRPDQVKAMIPAMDTAFSTIYKFNTNSPGWRDEMMQTSQVLSELGLQVFHGSNNWAVSGQKSASGKPMLANDMHLGFNLPGIWYQMHQVIPGKLDVTGVVLPGEPFVVAGHNDSIAWGLTNVMNDDMDFYKETIDSSGKKYKLDGTWRDLKIKHESIAIKGGDTIHTDFKFTHRGPIISELKNIDNENISMRWMGNEFSNEVRTIYLLNRASNWNDFKDAMKTFISISQNVVYADVRGNIGLYCCAGIPIRGKGDPISVLPGDSSVYDWKGLVPFDELPHIYNPKEGFVISANNRTINSANTYYITYWFDFPYRYNRIAQMLKSKEKLAVSDFEKIQTDETSWMVKLYLPELLKIIHSQNSSNTEFKSVINILDNWDGEMLASGAASAIFEVFYNKFVEDVVKDELGDTLFEELLPDKILVRNIFHNSFTNHDSPLLDDVTTPDIKETFHDIVSRAFNQTIDYLNDKMGNNPEEWQWGKIHTLTFEHPLGKVNILQKVFGFNRGPFEVSGSFHTVAPYTYKFNDLFNVTAGASQRHIYDAGNWDNSLSVIPTGTSGLCSSPYYSDQMKLYLKGKYHADIFSTQEVVKKAKYKAVFTP